MLTTGCRGSRRRVADEIEDGLKVELLGQPLAAVDDRELARARVGLGQQVFRLVEKAGVFERDTH